MVKSNVYAAQMGLFMTVNLFVKKSEASKATVSLTVIFATKLNNENTTFNFFNLPFPL
jgi:hypothetical protein